MLSLIASCLTLTGMVLLRPLMASRSIAYIVVLLTLASGVLALPNIGLYYGVQDWTARLTGGVVDARFIAIIDTTLESPLGQVAMIPMLTWIARNAPADLKATFFAVMASFTNMALTASSLLTKYLNQIFTVTREVRIRVSGAIPDARRLQPARLAADICRCLGCRGTTGGDCDGAEQPPPDQSVRLLIVRAVRRRQPSR